METVKKLETELRNCKNIGNIDINLNGNPMSKLDNFAPIVGPRPTENAERRLNDVTHLLRVVSSFTVSAMYDIATGRNPPQKPERNRNATKIHKFWTTDCIQYAAPTTQRLISKTGLRPYLSDAFPKNGEKIAAPRTKENCKTA